MYSAEQHIPKIIHQIWIGENKMPSIWMDTYKNDYVNMYKDYKYILWNESNIARLFDEFPIYKIVYELECTYNGKSDILRYLILYKYGGIYIDADSVWINNKNYDELLEQVNNSGVFVSSEPNSTAICGGIMGSTKNNIHMKNLIIGVEKYILEKNGKIKIINYRRIRKINGVCKIIGPIYMHNYLIDKNVTIFPSVYFYPMNWHGVSSIDEHKKINLPKESYSFQYGYTTNDLKKII
jgi:hypothetical protein